MFQLTLFYFESNIARACLMTVVIDVRSVNSVYIKDSAVFSGCSPFSPGKMTVGKSAIQPTFELLMAHHSTRREGKSESSCSHFPRRKSTSAKRVEIHNHFSERKVYLTLSCLSAHLVNRLLRENRKSIPKFFKTFQKCNPPNFKLYPSKLTNKNFPHMV